MSFEKMLHFIRWCFLRYVLGKGPFSPVRFKDILEKGRLASALKVYFEKKVHFIQCFLRYILEKGLFYPVLFKQYSVIAGKCNRNVTLILPSS